MDLFVDLNVILIKYGMVNSVSVIKIMQDMELIVNYVQQDHYLIMINHNVYVLQLIKYLYWIHSNVLYVQQIVNQMRRKIIVIVYKDLILMQKDNVYQIYQYVLRIKY